MGRNSNRINTYNRGNRANWVIVVLLLFTGHTMFHVEHIDSSTPVLYYVLARIARLSSIIARYVIVTNWLKILSTLPYEDWQSMPRSVKLVLLGY